MIDRIARTAVATCLMLAAAFALWKRDLSGPLGVIGGGLLIGISFWGTRSVVDALVRRSQSENGAKAGRFPLVKFFTRYAIVAVAAYGMMVRLHLDVLGLLAGVSSLVLAVVVEALRDLRWRRFL